MILRKAAFLFVFGFLLSAFVFAQKNEISFSVGAIHSSDQQTTIVDVPCPVSVPNCNQFSTSPNLGVALEGAFTRQLFTFGKSSLDFELPLVGVPSHDVTTRIPSNSFSVSASTWSLFFTPSARVKFFHSSPVSPLLSIEGALPHKAAGGRTNIGAVRSAGGGGVKSPVTHVPTRAKSELCR